MTESSCTSVALKSLGDDGTSDGTDNAQYRGAVKCIQPVFRQSLIIIIIIIMKYL